MGLPKRTFYIVGGAFLIMGLIIILNSFSGVTGYAVAGKVDSSIIIYTAIWLIAAGIVAIMLSRASVNRQRSKKK